MTRLPDALLRVPLTHRAYHDLSQGRAENSLSAIKAACQAGYGVELDLQLSAQLSELERQLGTISNADDGGQA